MAAPASNNLPDDRITIHCLHCGKAQEAGRKAMTITCRHCSKALKLEDIRIERYEARRVVETCGIITVERKGTVFADRLRCGGIVVRGKVKGAITSRGPIL